MATAIPALQGKFGETTYWLTTMRISELVQKCQFAQELPGWEDLTIEQRYQRELNLNRVRRDIAPYFANDSNRFSSALVLAVVNHEGLSFESLVNMSMRSSVPQLYRSAASPLGFLTLEGSEVLVPLDGQHRALAFKWAMNGVDNNGRDIPNMDGNLDFGMDWAPVILIKYEPSSARMIFNKLNRYAKPTQRGDNLITDDDDKLAVLTRALVGAGGVLTIDLVRLRGNTLTGKSREFTTLSTFYDANEKLVESLKLVGHGAMKQMSTDQLEVAQELVAEQWRLLFGGVDLWAKALKEPSHTGDQTRIQIREETILGRPIGQYALVWAFVELKERLQGVPVEELIDRLNTINWSIKDSRWEGVLINSGGRMMSGRTTARNAAMFITHQCGAALTQEEAEQLRKNIHGDAWEQHELPSPVSK